MAQRRPDRIAATAIAGLMAAGVLILVALLHGRGPAWFRWTLTTQYNPALLEAWSWWHGRLELPHSLWDTACVPETKRIYNAFPPLATLVGFVALAPWAGRALKDFPTLVHLPLLLLGWLPTVVAFAVFRSRTGRIGAAAILTLAWLGGTAVWSCMDQARADGVHHVNHLLSQIGLLIFAGELLGRRRTSVLIAGLLMAAWSRQLAILYALPLLWLGWMNRGGRGLSTQFDAAPPAPRAILLGLALIVAVPMALNAAKFGSPFETGYRYIYVDRTTGIAEDARAHGLFSAHFLPRNLYYMNLATPWSLDADGHPRWQPSPHGASLWLTSPILLMCVAAAGVWGRSPASRALMLASVAALAGHALYHNTGYVQYGYYRFALDVVPVWLIVAAPWLVTGWRLRLTVTCTFWSLIYFAMLSWWPAGVGN
jgi:hypothetical protein